MKHLYKILGISFLLLTSNDCSSLTDYAGECQDQSKTYGYLLQYEKYTPFNLNIIPIEDGATFSFESSDLYDVCVKYPMQIDFSLRFGEKLPVSVEARAYLNNTQVSLGQIGPADLCVEGPSYQLTYESMLYFDLTEAWEKPEDVPKYESVKIVLMVWLAQPEGYSGTYEDYFLSFEPSLYAGLTFAAKSSN